jgi:hypothetical protein
VPILISIAMFVAFAQQTQKAPPPPEISVEVKVVLLSATVRDKDGTNVPGLNKDDFVLYVDGHLRAISNVIPQSDVPLTLGLLVQSLGPHRQYALRNRSDASYGFLDHMLREIKTKRS